MAASAPSSLPILTRRRAGRFVAIATVFALLGIGQLSFAGDTSPAAAAIYDASTYPLKFASTTSPVNPTPITSGATGKSVGDVVRFNGVTTIDGIVIDAVVRTVAIQQVSITNFDGGGAVNAPPPGSSQSVGDLLLTDINTPTGSEPMVTFEFSFYEGGTYTGAGTGVPVTLANVAINSYDIDGLVNSKQFTDFRGFQSYKVYTDPGDPSNKGLAVLDQGGGLVRFISKSASLGATTTSGSYSWSRVQVNYDKISTLTIRLGVIGSQGAFFALDFSAGGIWTTNGTTPVTPEEHDNPFNTPPTTENITTFYAAQGTGYVFRAADFPYEDVDDNAFAAVQIVSLPAAGEGVLEYFDGADWVPATAGQVIATSDLDLGVLRLVPTATGGSFTFKVYDGLDFSSPATLTFFAPENAQAIDFPTPATQDGNAQRTFASGASASSGLTPTLTSLTPGVCTVSGLDITTLALPSGVTTATCVIVATQDGDASYGRAEAVTQQFSVTKLLAQTITFANPGNRAFDPAPIASGAVSDSGLAVTLSSLTPTVCTVSGLDIQPVSPGLCNVRASQPGNGTYSPASPVSQTFTLQKIAQAITFAPPATMTIDDGSVTLSPTTNAAGLTVTLTSSTPTVCTVSGLTVTFLDPGVCTVTASQPGDGTRSAASDVTRSFHIIQIATTALDAARAGSPFSQQLVVAGAGGGGVWSATGLPAGLSLNPTTGLLSGTPKGAFSGTVTISYLEDGALQLITLALDIEAAASSAPTGMASTGVDSTYAAGVGGLLILAGLAFTLASITRHRTRHPR